MHDHYVAVRPSRLPVGQRRWRRTALVCAALLTVVALAAGGVLVWLTGPGEQRRLEPRDEQAMLSVLPADARPLSTELTPDANSVELGLRFKAGVAGTVAGLRLYRGQSGEVAHDARLWAPDGTMLRDVRFEAPAAPGWQNALFDAPVPVDSAGYYTASYHASGGYLADVAYFDTGSAEPAAGAVALQPDPAGAGVFAYRSTPVPPVQTADGTNYWIDVLFLPSDSPSEAALSPAADPESVVPQPGDVGFTGDRSALTVIDSPASAPAGTVWSDNTLRVDSADVTMDRVWVKGSVDYYGEGTLTIRDSVVEANGSSWAVVWGRSVAGTLDISDSTLTWPADVPAPGPTWGTGAVNGESRMILVRNDISGSVDGVQQSTGNSLFQQNYIHDLRIYGSYPDNSHNDGLQLYGGPHIVVLANHIELKGYDGEHQNAAVFLSDDGPGFQAPQIIGNYLSGGGFALRLERGSTDALVMRNRFGPIAGGFGYIALGPGATLARWSDNTTVDGEVLPEPLAG